MSIHRIFIASLILTSAIVMAEQVTLKLKEANDDLAKELAKKHGFEVKGESFLDSHYFLHYSDPNLPVDQRHSQLENLNADPLVEWAKVEESKRRRKGLDEF